MEITLTPEEKRDIHLLTTLPQNEAFLLWRDKYCYPVLKQLRAQLKNPDVVKLSHVELLAKTLHLNSMEHFLEDIFDEALFLDKESENPE